MLGGGSAVAERWRALEKMVGLCWRKRQRRMRVGCGCGGGKLGGGRRRRLLFTFVGGVARMWGDRVGKRRKRKGRGEENGEFGIFLLFFLS